jgi:O-antigen ligase
MVIENNTLRDKYKNYVNFIPIPLVALGFFPVLNDSTGVPKIIVLLIGTLILVLNNIKIIEKISIYQLAPIFLIAIYGFNQLFLKINFESFLLGAFARNGGFIAITCFTIIFIHNSNLKIEKIKYFVRFFFITYYLLLLYGIAQILEVIPIKESRNYGSLTLTLQNPNFASAFLGMAISCQIILILETKKNRFIQVLILMIAVYELFQTNSIQGFLLLIFGLSIYLISRKNIKLKQFNLKLFLLTSPLIIFVFANTSRIIDWLIVNGSVVQRLSYWELAVNIWKDNYLFGVGIDNMSNYSTLYRNLELTQQEGVFTTPDRAHNVILDHFVNGGFFGGLIWVVFVVLISFLALKVIKNSSNQLPNYQIIVIVIWFCYLLQSLISVDELFLTLLGYSSAGIIISIASQRNLNKGGSLKRINLNISGRLILLPILSFLLLFTLSIAKFEQNAYKFLILGKESSLVDLYGSKYVQSKTLEDVAIKISQDKDFEMANKFANRLLLKKPSSHQAYYIKSVYYESIKSDTEARKAMLEALKIDKYNSVYLLSMAIYDYKLGYIDSSRDYFERAKISYPEQIGIDVVEKMLFP